MRRTDGRTRRLQDRGCNTSIAYRRFDTPEVITAYVVDVGGVEVPGKAAVAADQATAGRTDGRTCLQHCRMYSSDSARRRFDTRIQIIHNKQVAVTPLSSTVTSYECVRPVSYTHLTLPTKRIV